MSNNYPIGIFDSGVGGLSVWKEIIKELPRENTIYFADSANCPYGPKRTEEIVDLVLKVVDFLIRNKCKAIIVACNTATAAAIDYLRSNYKIPFIGMEPAVKPAALHSVTKSIAVLATEGTFNGRLYIETSERFAKDVQLNIKVGEKLVELVEKGLQHDDSTKKYISNLIEPLLDLNIDHLVLGCTHYPFLIPVLSELLPKGIKIIDPAPAVAKQTRNILIEKGLINQQLDNPYYKFYTSGDQKYLDKFIKGITDKTYNIESI